jgi:hypothetical protein
MAKIFAKFGAVRDENLNDLTSGEVALNILLNRIKGGAESFTSADLELIRGLFSTNVTSGTLDSAADATVTVTGSNGLQTVYDPLITLANRFDRAYFTTSEPYFLGGDGPTARYFDNNQIIRSGAGATTNFLGFNQVFDTEDGRVIPNPATGIELASDVDNFWEEGDFYYGNKIRNKLLSAYGGVEWTGYFKPTVTGNWSWVINTTGYVKVEFDNREAPSKGFTFNPSTGTFKLNDTDFRNPQGLTTLVDQTKLSDAGIPISASISGNITNATDKGVNYGRFGSGGTAFLSQTTTGSGIYFNIGRDIANGNLVITSTFPTTGGIDGYNVGDTFTISGSLVGQTGNDITLTLTDVGGYYIFNSVTNQQLGTATIGTNRELTINLGDLVAYEAYKFRISFFIDEDSVDKMNEIQVSGPIIKQIIFDRRPPDVTTTTSSAYDFDYKYLYGDRYFDFYNIGDFKKFIDSSISSGGSRIGNKRAVGDTTSSAEGSPGDKYAALLNLNPVVSYYQAPLTTSAEELITIRTGNVSSLTRNIVLGNTNPTNGQLLPNKTENIEIGNYVVGPGIPIGSRVVSVTINDSVLIDRTPTSTTTSATLNFIPHKGLVGFGKGGYYTGSASNADGFALGQRALSSLSIKSGSVINLAEAGSSYGNFSKVIGTGSLGYQTNSSGSNAVISVARNQFGALTFTIVNGGTGYSNYDLITIAGNYIGQPGNDLTLEIVALNDTFIVGRPEYVIKPGQIFKHADLPASSKIQYTDKFTNPSINITRTFNDTQIIKRLYSASNKDTTYALSNNTILWKTKLVNDSEITTLYSGANPGLNKYWFIYQTFGLNNDALGGYCTGVFDARIEQKLSIINVADGSGSGYVSNVLPVGASPTPATTTTLSGSGFGMKVWYKAAGNITYVWMAEPGQNYEAGDRIQINGGNNNARYTVGYPNITSNTITFRVSGSEIEFSNNGSAVSGYYAHLFPSLAYNSPTNDVNDLVGEVRISSVEYPILGSENPSSLGTYLDTAALVTLQHESGGSNAVQNNEISYVDSVVTRITFTPPASPNQNKEVCFRPTDTSPPFAATSSGLTTSNEVKMVLSFTSSGLANAGTFNPGRLTYDNITLNTNRSLNEVALVSNPLPQDIISGYIPITCGKAGGGTEQFYLLLGNTYSSGDGAVVSG